MLQCNKGMVAGWLEVVNAMHFTNCLTAAVPPVPVRACIFILLVSTSLAAAQLYITHTAEGGKEETQILSMQISSQLFSSFKTLTSSHRIPSTSSTCLITNDFLLIDRWLNKAAAFSNKTSNMILSVIQREYEAIFC